MQETTLEDEIVFGPDALTVQRLQLLEVTTGVVLTSSMDQSMVLCPFLKYWAVPEAVSLVAISLVGATT